MIIKILLITFIMFGSQKVWGKIQGKENTEEKQKKIKNKEK